MAEDAKSGLRFDLDTSRGDSKKGRGQTVPSRKDSVSQTAIQLYKTGLTWDDVVDLEDVKKTVQQTIVYPSMRPDLFPLGWPRGILLYGPPGCGKTTVAAAVSTEIDGYFIAVDAASIMSKWLGEAEKNVSIIFNQMRDLASEGKPVILFIDEVDSLLGIRQQEVGGEVRVRNQFLKEMDGLSDKSNTSIHTYVVASTNKPWALDWGFIRRFQRRIYIPMPNEEIRKDLFQYFIKKLNITDGVDFDELSKLTEGYTPSDVRDISQTAVIEVVTELFESGKAVDYSSRPRPVTMNDLKDAIKRIRPSVSSDIQRVYDAWAQRFSAI